MNTGPVQGMQADVPGDFRTFKLDASGCECEYVAFFFGFASVRLKLLCLLYI